MGHKHIHDLSPGKFGNQAGIELATPRSAVIHLSVVRHVTDYITWPGTLLLCRGFPSTLDRYLETLSSANLNIVFN